MVFDEFCKPCDRPFLTAEIRKEIAGKQKGKCNMYVTEYFRSIWWCGLTRSVRSGETRDGTQNKVDSR